LKIGQAKNQESEMRNSVLLAFVAAMGLALLSTLAEAQPFVRTWVSNIGVDPPTHNCSVTQPCLTFYGALGNTSSGGEINCLTPGDFGGGGFTISKPVSIVCPFGAAGVAAPSGYTAIDVNLAAGQRVVLDGLDIEGGGVGDDGVVFNGYGLLIIRNCSIRDFAAAGVYVAGSPSTPAPRVLIQNCLITGNGGGVLVQGNGGPNNAEVVNSLIDSNTSYNIQVAGASTLVLSASTLTGTSPNDILISGGGSVISYGNNVLRNAGAPTSTLPLQ
jgi:parallel beta helix pectate lyase-like protein